MVRRNIQRNGSILFTVIIVILAQFIDYSKVTKAKCISYGTAMLIIALFIFYVKQKQTYWQRMGVKTSESSFLVGHMLKRFGLTEPFWKFYDEMYYKYNAKEFCGSYDFLRPTLILGNLQMVKQVLIKDFDCFSERRTLPLGKVCPMADDMLSNSHGEKWYQIRKALSPTFTTMKLRQLLPLINERCDILVRHLQNAARNEKEVKAKEYCGTFTMETIMSCAFGVQFSKESYNVDEFTQMGKRIFQLSVTRAIKIIILLITPIIASVLGSLGVQFSSQEFLFFENKVRQTLQARRVMGIRRGDFLDIMWESGRLSENSIISQAILFLLAGYDNTANTISFALHLLAVNPDVQQKLRNELQKTIKEQGEFANDDYKIINACGYLDAVIKETLRLYPVSPVIERKCTKSTTIYGTNIPIEKGQIIIIPIWNLHRDPEYWEEHNIFKPERFLDSPNNLAYMPFGQGPRNCIGMRFGNLVVKTALFSILREMEVKPSENTIDPPSLDGRILTLQTTNGLPLKFVPLS